MIRDTMVLVFRLFVFVTILGSIVLHPILQTQALLEKQEFVVIDFGLDSDVGDNESQEEDENKDNKIESLLSIVDQNKMDSTKKDFIFGKQYLLKDFTLEIFIPPPKKERPIFV